MTVSLKKISTAAEVVGAITVLIGLVFVGLEIRQNTRAQIFDSTQALISEFNNSLRLLPTAGLGRLMLRGFHSFSNLEPVEKVEYSAALLPAVRAWEQLYYASLDGMIDPNVYGGIERQMQTTFRLPGIRDYWSIRREWFGGRFQQYIDGFILQSEPATTGYYGFQGCEE